VDVVTELEHLRRLRLSGTTPAPIFFQLKKIFHFLESLGSARIEGNHTTLADYIESTVNTEALPSDHLLEINNIEQAMSYIEETIQADDAISEHFIRELHAITVSALVREGDKTPGAYRETNVKISQSEHLPPEHYRVSEYMKELVSFVNEQHPAKYDLIKIALAHHRFGWIHPFSNGNGRVVRLLTYALLIKFGFNVKVGGRVLNPTAVFCNNRDTYYQMLSLADTGTPEALESWCLYVLQGVLSELQKVDQLTDYDYLQNYVLLPALSYAKERQLITQLEYELLVIAVREKLIRSSDYAKLIPNERQRTHQIKKLVDAKLLRPIEQGARQYTIGFSNNYLLRGVIHALTTEGFISESLVGERIPQV
jgi:Fic family protein